MRLCKTCGHEIEDGKKICMFCGCAIDEPGSVQKDTKEVEIVVNKVTKSSQESYVALTLAIVGIVANFIATPIAGIVLEIVALIMARRIRNNTDESDTCANITMAISIVSLALIAVILLIIAIIVIGYLLIAGSLATTLMGAYM